MTSKLSRALCAVSCALALAACNDPNAVDASIPTIADTLVVFAMNGTAPAAPSAWNAVTGAISRTNGAFSWDLAFDIDDTGDARIMPLSSVAGPYSPRIVGVQRLSVAFDGLGRAPSSGYVLDSTFTVQPGEGVVLRINAEVCQLDFSPYRYAKLVVDSVDLPSRRLFIRTVRDPNCGFRSFEPGVPGS
jgi:hypothetical protein